jgi:hypothetical protein
VNKEFVRNKRFGFIESVDNRKHDSRDGDNNESQINHNKVMKVEDFGHSRRSRVLEKEHIILRYIKFK